MPRQARQPSATGIHHIMIRGINRQRIFLEDADYAYFLETLRHVRDASACTVLAYCCMPNHVHLLLEEGTEPVSLVMKRLGVRYAGWFNTKYERVGHLLQDRFLSRPVENDPYLLTVVLYIHYNPVAAGLCDRPTDYPWSSRPTLGSQHSLVDLARLGQLLPLDAITEAEAHHEPVAGTGDHLVGRGYAESHRVDDAWPLVTLASGASSTLAFQRLAPSEQLTAVRTLRAWDMPIRTIASLTGLDRNAIWRWGTGTSEQREPGVPLAG